MEKGIEAIDIIYKWKLDSLSSARLNLLKKNAHLQELLSKKEPRGASHNEVDTPLLPMNDIKENESEQVLKELQLSALNPSPFQIFSAGSEKAVSLPATASIITSFLMLLMLIYSILVLVLIVIIWIVVRKKL